MNVYESLTRGKKESEEQFQIPGIATGIVTDIKDERGVGCVKVCCESIASGHDTGWIRVASFAAGAQRGAFFGPEIGDEVLVAFAGGDLRAPYVIGVLWSEVDLPPVRDQSGKNHIRSIVSRSGHALRFIDDKENGKEKIEIQSQGGHTIMLDDESGAEKIEIRDKTGNNCITIDTNENAITVQGTSVTVEAKAELTLKSQGTLTIQGQLVKIN